MKILTNLCGVSAWFCGIAILFVCPLVGSGNDVAPQVHNYHLTFSKTGSQDADKPHDLEHFLKRLDGRPELAVSYAGQRPWRKWQSPLPDSPAKETIHMVLAQFGARQNWMIFQFNKDHSRLKLAVWRQATTADVNSGYAHTIPPGPKQIESQAVLELAAEFAQTVAGGNGPEKRVPLKVIVSSAKESGEDIETSNMKAEATHLPSEEELGGIETVALAAAWHAGFVPEFGKSGCGVLKLQVEGLVKGYRINATYQNGSDTYTVSGKDLGEERLYPGLSALIKQVVRWRNKVSDFTFLADGPVEIMGISDESVAFLHDDELAGSSLVKGREIWRIRRPARNAPTYASFTNPKGQAVFRQTGVLRSGGIDCSTGDNAGISLKSYINYPWSLAEKSQDDYAYCRGPRLYYVSNSRQRWDTRLGLEIAAGPAFAGDDLIIGDAGGMLTAIRRQDGTSVWQTDLEKRLFGPLLITKKSIYVSSTDGSIFAVDLQSGKKLWETFLRDVPLGSLCMVDGAILVASGDRHVRRINPNTGGIEKDIELPLRLLCGLPVRNGNTNYFVTTDVEGTVRFHDPNDLKCLQVTSLDTQLNGIPAFVEKIALRLQSREPTGDLQGEMSLAPHEPALTVVDHWGILYILPLPERRK